MAVFVPPHVEDQIRRLVATGQYNDASDVIERAVGLLEVRERDDRLRVSVAEAFAAIRRGEGVELTPGLLDELEAEGREMDRQGIPIGSDVLP